MGALVPAYYIDLPKPVRALLRHRTEEIRVLHRRAAKDIVSIGQKLLDVKEKIGHGQFGLWLMAEFEWSQDTAERFMNVARSFSKIRTVRNFDAKALYMLSAPSAPSDARDEAEALAEAGETITAKRAAEIIAGKRKPAEVMAELSPEEQEELLALTSQHYERKAEARAAAVPEPEEADRADVVMVRKHMDLACKRLEALLERSSLEPPEKHNAAKKLLKVLQAELACPLFQ